MSLLKRLPPSILGGDSFNRFRFLYRKELWWKLCDEEYCFSVMYAAYEAGGRAFDLSFEENTRLFKRLVEDTGDKLIGFGNPSWEQGVFLNGRYIMLSRDRVIRTLVDRFFLPHIARLVDEKLSHEAVLVFGYDPEAEPLTDEEIANIALDKDTFRRRLSIFKFKDKNCRYILFGGTDADFLIPLGRMDVVAEMVRVVRDEGFAPVLLCQYPTLVVPAAEDTGLDVEGYAVPLNRDWSWFDRDECVKIVRSLDKPVIAFMPLASGALKKDVRGAFDWLYSQAGVESILFGASTIKQARETTITAQASREAADINR